jgi:uncharacterized protein YjbJ (UPF0337 family)
MPIAASVRRKKRLTAKEEDMNRDVLAGKWKQMKGSIKEQWGKLTDDELDVVAGRYDKLAGLLQERYGWAKDRAERELDQFLEHTPDPEMESTRPSPRMR